MYVGCMEEGDKEGILVLICHVESERNELLNLLQTFSIPFGGSPVDKVPVQLDNTYKVGIFSVVRDGSSIILKTFMGRQGAEGLVLVKVLLTPTELVELSVNFELWLPKEDQESSDSNNGDSS